MKKGWKEGWRGMSERRQLLWQGKCDDAKKRRGALSVQVWECEERGVNERRASSRVKWRVRGMVVDEGNTCDGVVMMAMKAWGALMDYVCGSVWFRVHC